MPVKEGESARARIFQVIILALNFMGAILVSISLGLTIKEYEQPAHELAQLTKLALTIDNPQVEVRYENKRQLYANAAVMDAGLYFATSVAGVVLLYTILVMVATVIEQRNTLIATIVVSGLLCAASLIAAIMLFVGKWKSGKLGAVIFSEAMYHYHLIAAPLNAKEASAIAGYVRFIDRVQTNTKCCGLGDQNYTWDYYANEFRRIGNKSVCIPGYGFQQVPYSCCKSHKSDQGGLLAACATAGVACIGSDKIDPSHYIYTAKCGGKFSEYLSSVDMLAALYLTLFIFLVSITVLVFLLTREVVDPSKLVLPPVRELAKMGLGDQTINILAANADEIQGGKQRSGGGGGGDYGTVAAGNGTYATIGGGDTTATARR